MKLMDNLHVEDSIEGLLIYLLLDGVLRRTFLYDFNNIFRICHSSFKSQHGMEISYVDELLIIITLDSQT